MLTGYDPPPWNMLEEPAKTQGWIAHQDQLRKQQDWQEWDELYRALRTLPGKSVGSASEHVQKVLEYIMKRLEP